jgi:long-chain acyl-CoA synthetase
LQRYETLLTPLAMIDPTDIWRTRYVHPGQWDVTYSPMTLTAMFDASVAQHGAAVLTDFLGSRLTYAQVGARVDRFAATLAGWGLAKGDRVGLYLPNVPDYLVAYYGALKAGAIVVNMSPLYSRAELAHQTADSGARIVVTTDVPAMFDTANALLDDRLIDRLVVGNLSGGLPLVKRWLFRRFRGAEVAAIPDGDPRIVRVSAMIATQTAAPAIAVSPEDIALIQYTGGTTGTPKGAMLTHASMTANARQVHAIDPRPEAPDRIVGVLPFFHVFANTCVLNRTVLTGGMIAMLPRFGAKDTLKTIQRVKATSLPGVPTMYQALLDHPDCARTDFSSLRACISGAAPLAETLKAKFEAMTGAKVIEGYGLTEVAGVVACNPYEGANKGGTIGQPIPGTHVTLVDRDDPSRPPPDGEPGELVVEGPQVMAGYWGHIEQAEDFVRTATGRALRTGDIATIDSDGYIRIVDRLKDMIAVGGFKVFPSQVEEVLYRHAAVKEAIVIGIADAYHGEMPKAFVTLNEGFEVEGDALKSWLNPQLGKHERVAAVEVRAELPKTLVGKLSRKELVAEERAKAAA